MSKSKKSVLAAFKSKSKAVVTTTTKVNPPPVTDLVEFILPSFAGYAGTRFTSRAIHGMILKKAPKFAKHASVLSTFAAAGGAYLLVHRVKKISRYHTPVVCGAGIAALQTLVQAYVPKYGWLVSDHNINVKVPQAPVAVQSTQTSLPAPVARVGGEKTTTILVESDPLLVELEEMDLGSLAVDVDGDGISDADLADLLN